MNQVVTYNREQNEYYNHLVDLTIERAKAEVGYAKAEEEYAKAIEGRDQAREEIANAREKRAAADQKIANAQRKGAAADQKIANAQRKGAAADQKIAAADQKIAQGYATQIMVARRFLEKYGSADAIAKNPEVVKMAKMNPQKAQDLISLARQLESEQS